MSKFLKFEFNFIYCVNTVQEESDWYITNEIYVFCTSLGTVFISAQEKRI